MKRLVFGREPRIYSEISDFKNLSALGHFYSLYHFYVIDLHYVRCLDTFLPLYDHFEIRRFLDPNWQLILAETLSYLNCSYFLHF